jgi:hypothetical protein
LGAWGRVRAEGLRLFAADRRQMLPHYWVTHEIFR